MNNISVLNTIALAFPEDIIPLSLVCSVSYEMSDVSSVIGIL